MATSDEEIFKRDSYSNRKDSYNKNSYIEVYKCVLHVFFWIVTLIILDILYIIFLKFFLDGI